MAKYTITDIAKFAGVSVTTVSRVINGYKDVGASTKAKVLEVISNYDFTPNANAKNLKLISSNTIAIIVKGKDNIFFSSIAVPIEDAIPKNLFNVSVTYIGEEDNEYTVARNLSAEQKLEGIIFIGGTITQHINMPDYLTIPCVFVTVNANGLDYPNVSSVSVDDERAARYAVSVLVKKGHRKIAVVGGDVPDISAIGQRYRGAVRAFSEAGIDDYRQRMVASRFNIRSSYKVVTEFLKAKPEVTAIFAMSDTIAFGAAKACFDLGYLVPDDISIIGFDGLDIARFYSPSIATISQPKKSIADKAVELLIGGISGQIRNTHVILPFKFENGGSIRQL